MNETKKQPGTWQYASLVSTLGKLAWIFGIINGVIEIIFALWGIGAGLALQALYAPYYTYIPSYEICYIIGAIILIFVSVAIIRPKFSTKCAEQDWESLYSWVLTLGSTNIPWMLIWGIIFTIFSWWYWGGIFVLLPAILLLFMGPREYKWSTQ